MQESATKTEDRIEQLIESVQRLCASQDARLAALERAVLHPGSQPLFAHPHFAQSYPHPALVPHQQFLQSQYGPQHYYSQPAWPAPPSFPYALDSARQQLPVQVDPLAASSAVLPNQAAQPSQPASVVNRDAKPLRPNLSCTADSIDLANGFSQTAQDPAGKQSVPSRQSRVHVVNNMLNKSTSEWEDQDAINGQSITSQERAATFRRHFDADDDTLILSEEIEINSQDLKQLVAAIVPWKHDDAVSTDDTVTIKAPFDSFVWHWDDFGKACTIKSDDFEGVKLARKDLRDLMGLIQKSNALRSYFRHRRSMRQNRTIRHEFLWTLFSHGCDVYVRSCMNELQMFEVVTCSNATSLTKAFVVRCAAFDWDGTRFSTYNYDFYIPEFQGEKRISALEVVPVDFYCDGNGINDDRPLRRALLNRGRKFLNLCLQDSGMVQCHYRGPALVTPPVSGTQSGLCSVESEVMSTRTAESTGTKVGGIQAIQMNITRNQTWVIIDSYSFLASNRNTMKRGNKPPLGHRASTPELGCTCSLCKSSALMQWSPEPGLDVDLQSMGKAFQKREERLMYLPPRLLGFASKEKLWGQFLVDNLARVSQSFKDENKGPFWDELQLDSGDKQLLWAFVQNHKAPGLQKSNLQAGDIDPATFDIVTGKGQGLVIFLHGPPGVGKTLTAETLALATGRPLLTMTPADIGKGATEVERNLTEIFADAARWEVILLFDEADAFVEERMKGDMERNAMVSVMLRWIEYYDGILILTSNRAQVIDSALQSRVQLAIRYSNLTKTQSLNIYLNRLMWVPEDEIEDRAQLESQLQSSPLFRHSIQPNGRQIRNIVAYARALAKAEQKLLTINHLVSVDSSISDFNVSLKSVSERQRAKNEIGYDLHD